MRAFSKLLIVAFAVLIAPRAIACPDCPEGIRRQVNAGIFDESFLQNLGMAALPFGVLAAIGAAMHVGSRASRGRHG